MLLVAVIALGAAGASFVVLTGAGGGKVRPTASTGSAPGSVPRSTTTTVPVDVFDVPAVAQYLAGTGVDLTAAVYDAVNGRTSLYRPGVAQDTASIVKVDILATLLHQAQQRGASLDADQQTLAQEMIEQSDNDAATALWDEVGEAPAVAAFDDEAGLTQTTPNVAWGLTTTTAADQVKLLDQIAFPSLLLGAAARQYELGLMEDVESSQAWGISAGVAPGATLAIKNGWLPLDAGGWQVNSIGYVDGDGRDYVIAVLVQSPTEYAGINAIEGLSTLVWNTLG